MIGIFGIPESSSMQWYQDVAPIQEFFFFPHRHIYSLYVCDERIDVIWKSELVSFSSSTTKPPGIFSSVALSWVDRSGRKATKQEAEHSLVEHAGENYFSLFRKWDTSNLVISIRFVDGALKCRSQRPRDQQRFPFMLLNRTGELIPSPIKQESTREGDLARNQRALVIDSGWSPH